MQDTRAAAPRVRTPLIAVPVHSIDVGQVQQRGDGGLLGALAAEEVGGRFGQDDADRERVLVLGQGLDDDRDCAGVSELREWETRGIS
jgi:hypothetical protein